MLNHSADHALRSVLYIAQREGTGTVRSADIARATGIPRNYLGKVLHALGRAGLLESERGPQGGFRLAVPAERLTIADVVQPFQRLPQRTVCLLGDRSCDGSEPCAAHRQWQAMSEGVNAFFRGTTIDSMLAGAASPAVAASTPSTGGPTGAAAVPMTPRRTAP